MKTINFSVVLHPRLKSIAPMVIENRFSGVVK